MHLNGVRLENWVIDKQQNKELMEISCRARQDVEVGERRIGIVSEARSEIRGNDVLHHAIIHLSFPGPSRGRRPMCGSR